MKELTELAELAERFLFGGGLQLKNYYIERTPVSEMLCYRDAEGREFDLPISNPALAEAVISRLKEPGVEIITLE